MTVDGHACWYLCHSKNAFQLYQCLPTPMQHATCLYLNISNAINVSSFFSSPRTSSWFFFSEHFNISFLFSSLQRLLLPPTLNPQQLTCLVLPLPPCLCVWMCSAPARTRLLRLPVCPDDVRGRHEEQSETFHHWEHWGEWPGDDSRVPQSCPRRPLRETWHGTKRQPDRSVLIDEELLSALQWFQLGDSFFSCRLLVPPLSSPLSPPS